MVFKIEKFSLCVFANIYRSYKEKSVNDACSKMNLPDNFEIPERFYADVNKGDIPTEHNYIQDGIIQFLEALDNDFNADKEGERYIELFNKVCSSRSALTQYILKHLKPLSDYHIHSLFVATYALIAELNWFCIDRECFRHAVDVVYVLNTVFKEIKNLQTFSKKFEKKFDDMVKTKEFIFKEKQEKLLQILVNNINESMDADLKENYEEDEPNEPTSEGENEEVMYSIDEQSKPSCSKKGSDTECLLDDVESIGADSPVEDDKAKTIPQVQLKKCNFCGKNCASAIDDFVVKFSKIVCSDLSI